MLALAKALLVDFSQHSTIHGIQYIAEKNRSWFERILWLVIFCISLGCCGKLIYDAWHIHPIIISFADKPTPVWQIPFPSVFVCPRTLAQKEKLNITDVINRLEHGTPFRDLSEIEQTRFGALSPFCSTMSYYDLGNATSCNWCLETVREIQIPAGDIFVECQFETKPFDCIEVFKEIIAADSMCYSFNGLDVYRQEARINPSQAWTIDGGYGSGTGLNTYPLRGTAAGIRNGLSILLKVNRADFHNSCILPSFEISFQLPNELGPLEVDVWEVGLQQSVNIALQPRIMTTSNSLRDYPVEKRNCYYSNERWLRFFNVYTQYNCENECEANATLELCGCVPLNFPEFHGLQSCGPGLMACHDYYKSQFMRRELGDCNCLPGCNSIQFGKEISVYDLNTTYLAAVHDDHLVGFEYTYISVYFKENEFITSHRALLYGSTEFYAKCGGLLGLFLGVSVVSIIELFYFCTIRLFFNLKDKTRSTILEQKLVLTSSWLLLTRELIADYFSKSTIQGFNYISDNQRPTLERLWWFIVFVISLFCCASLILEVYDRYDNSPIIVGFSEKETSILDIPFPAVTICSKRVTNKKLFDVVHMYQLFHGKNLSLNQLNEEEISQLTAVAQVCDPDLFKAVDPTNQTNCENCVSNLYELMAGLDGPIGLTHCIDFFEDDNCTDRLQEVVTEEGICITYNAMSYYRNATDDAPVSWTLEDGFVANDVLLFDNRPRKGSKHPLDVDLKMELWNNDFICKGALQGHQVYLHLPIEAPQTTKNYYLVPLQQNLVLTVVPKMTLMSNELQDYSVDKRRCYFNSERYLRFFKYYTQNNCESDCMANLTLSRCGCLRFHLPKIEGVKYCGIGEIQCYQSLVQHKNIHQLMSTCDCLPGCTSLNYDAEVYQGHISLEFADFNVSGISVTFNAGQFVAVQQSQLYGTTEMVANCGGLLGLFLGFSFMSILEIVYFGTVRLFCNIQMRMRKPN